MCYLLIDIIFQSSSFSAQKSNKRICILCIIANNFQQRDRKRVLDFTIHHSHTSVKYNSGLKLQSSNFSAIWQNIEFFLWFRRSTLYMYNLSRVFSRSPECPLFRMEDFCYPDRVSENCIFRTAVSFIVHKSFPPPALWNLYLHTYICET